MLPTDSALALAARLRRRELSSVELVRACLATIRRDSPALSAFVDVSERRALADARRAGARIAAGDQAPFLGVPTAIKDHEHVRGHFTRMGSRAFRWLWSPVEPSTRWMHAHGRTISEAAARTGRVAGFSPTQRPRCS